VETAVVEGDVKVKDIAVEENTLVGDAVTYYFVGGGADVVVVVVVVVCSFKRPT